MKTHYFKKWYYLVPFTSLMFLFSGQLFAYTAPAALQVLWTGADQTPTCHGFGDYIDNVTLTGPNPGTATIISNNTSGHPAGWHYDYGRSPQIAAGEVTKGQSYSISITVAGSDLLYQHLAVYVDWNQDTENGTADGLTLDNLENPCVWYNYATGNGTYTLTGTINVPVGAATGYIYMRVSLDADGGGVSGGDYLCAVGYGEFEDYVLNVSAGTSAPTVTTAATSLISTISATLGGNVTADGGAAVTDRGVVYSTTDATPTIAEGATQVAIGSGTGIFSQSVSPFTQGATYYYNAYAINTAGTGYGTATSFTTLLPTITSATYDASTGVLSLTCTNMTTGDDINPAKMTLTGEGGTTYTLTTANVTASSSTLATITLNATDLGAINQIMNKNGTSSTGATTYNLAAADDWDASITSGNSADATSGITVGNLAVPVITSATYNAATGALVVTGNGYLKLSGATNDIDVSKLTITGEGGSTYTLTTTGVEITSGTSFTVTLNASDLAAINQILNKNGTSSTGATTYNLGAVEDWAAGADAAVVVADLTGNGITVSNVAVPVITSATYDAATGALVVTGIGYLKLSGATNDIDVSKLTITGEGGSTYSLTTTSVEITSGTSFTVTLNGTDVAAVNLIANKNGTSSTDATTYNLAAAEDWVAGADAAVVVADLTGNGITVSNVAVPAITSATYNTATGALVVTGNGYLKLSGATNDIDVSKLTVTGEGGSSYTLTTTDVEITSGTSFTVTLNATDLAAINQILNKNGTSSTGATTYNLGAVEDWAAGADAAVVVADLTGNGITVSNVAVPAITSATYDAATGALVVTGIGYLKLSGATNDIDVSKLTITGEGGSTYTLTTTSVEITSGTSFTVTLNATDLDAINQILNKNGTSSTGTTAYNLAATEDWAAGADAAVDVADLTGNGITVSNVAVPAITSATYNAATGALVITGTGYLKLSGATNDIDVSKLTITGEGGSTYTLTTTSVEITSGTSFTVTLNGPDVAAVNLIANKNGTSATDATTYNLAAAEDWAAGVDAAVVVADLTGNGITVSNVTVPAITSATYDAATGALVVTGTGYLKLSGAVNDIDVSKLTITGEGGSTYTLTTTSVEIISGTSFTVNLNGTDVAAVNLIVNKNGISSTGATIYNLVASEDWAAGADAAVVVADLTGNGITVSNVAVPAITSATYNAATGALVVTGTGYLKLNGATNDIDVSKLTITGEGGSTYTSTTASVEITSGTSFMVTLNATDLSAVNQILNKNGTSSTGATTYNLAAAEDWAAGADAAAVVADLTGNGITVSNVAVPAITSATYNAATGALVVTGTGYLKLNGASNDIDVSKLTITGEGGSTYTLTDTPDVEITSGTVFTVVLSVTDKAAASLVLNKNGTSSVNGTTYNLGAAEDWITGVDAAIVVADLTGNGISASNFGATVSTVAVPINANYTEGQNLDFTVNYDESITVTGTPQISLIVGSATKYATYLIGSGTTDLIFRYTVQTGDLDTDGVSLGMAINLNGGTLKNGSGIDATLTLKSVGSTSGVLVDAVVPTVLSVGIPSDGTYLSGQNLDFTVNFSEPVVIVTSGGTPYLTLTIGSSSVHASYLSGSGSTAVTFRYTVVSGNLDIDGITVGALTANGGTIKDAATNNATLTLNSVGSTSGVLVDSVVPTVLSVGVPSDYTYLSGQNLSFTVNFSEPVVVVTSGGTPYLTLTIGSSSVHASYLSGSGTTAIIFRYQVAPGNLDIDGITVGALTANGGTIKDAVTNDATLTLNSVGNTSGVLVDAIVPTVSSVGVPSDGTYLSGQNLNFTINFSESVVVVTSGGTPYITLTIGSSSVHAGYLSGSGTNAIIFRYTVVSGNLDIDGITVGALIANGGTMEDAAMNDATLTLNSVGNTSGVLVDAVAPTVSNVSSGTANGTYKIGDVISIQVTFSETAIVTGTPTLVLNSGGTATYTSGTGSGSLTFSYTVGSGESSADLDYSAANSLALAGGTIKDAAGNDATLTLPTVGGASSLGGQKDLVVGIVPTVTTQAVSNIGSTTATGNGNITSLGFPNPTAYGVCWNTGGTPTTSDSKVDKGAVSATGAFTAGMTLLAMGTTYHVRAFATNAAGTAYGSEVSFTTTTTTIPDAPTSVYANPGVGKSTVSFNTPTFDGGSPITGYTVTSIPDGISATGTSSPITVTGLTNGSNYIFTVTATNIIGTSVPSAASNEIRTPLRPGAPENVTASAGDRQAIISFSAPERNGGNLIYEYTVTSSLGGFKESGSSSPLIITGLTNGTLYTFTVIATNEVGEGPSSEPSLAVTPYSLTTTWKGIGTWDEASKWDNGVPSPQTRITIDGDVILTANTSVNKINHLLNSTLTIAANKTLTVTDTIRNYGTIVNNGTILGVVLVPVVFEENGGSEVSDVMMPYGSSFDLPHSVKSGYVLENWYTDMALTQVYVQAPMPLNRLTLYAKWKFPTEVITLEEETLKLYPNPTTDGFTVTAGSKETLLMISDLNGRKVLSRQVSGLDYVNVSNLVPGIYLVRLNDQNCKLVKR